MAPLRSVSFFIKAFFAGAVYHLISACATLPLALRGNRINPPMPRSSDHQRAKYSFAVHSQFALAGNKLPQFREIHTVNHIRLLRPGAAGNLNTHSDLIESGDAVGIGID